MIDHIHILCGIGAIGSPNIIDEDNDACVVQMQMRYIKTNYTKHISPKLFYPHQLHKKVERLVSCKQNHTTRNLTFYVIL
jgi:hypothetical protein